MKAHRLAPVAALLLALVACSPAPSPESAANPNVPPPVPEAVLEQAKGLIGLKNTSHGFIGPVATLACRGVGDSGPLGDYVASEWSYIIFECVGHTVMALSRKQSGEYENTIRRIEDVLALPETFEPYGHPDPEPFPWRLSGNIMNDGCDIEGHPKGAAVFGLSRRNDLPEVRLAKAWMFNLDQGRIVPIDPALVTCDYTDP
jgi:hypothetical protein